jgi:hypothetical protein
MLSEYQRAEGSESRLNDREEGSWAYRPAEDLKNYTGPLPFGWATNSTFIMGRASSLIAHSVNPYVFCTTRGPFEGRTLNSFRTNGNPSVDSYITFDRQLLEQALRDLFAHVSGDGFVWRRSVTYIGGAKRTVVGVSQVGDIPASMSPDDVCRAVFTKPRKFQHEREFRFAAFPRKPEAHRAPILVKNDAPDFAAPIAAAVLAHSSSS